MSQNDLFSLVIFWCRFDASYYLIFIFIFLLLILSCSYSMEAVFWNRFNFVFCILLFDGGLSVFMSLYIWYFVVFVSSFIRRRPSSAINQQYSSWSNIELRRCSIDGIKASYFFPLCQLVSDLQFSDREKSLTCFRTYCDRPGSTVNPLRHARHGWRRRDRHFTATAAASVDAIATPVDEAAFAAPPPPPTPPSPRRRRRRRCSCGCSTRRTMPRLVRELVAGSKATVPTPQNFVVRFASENRSKCQFTKQLVLGKGCISNYKWNLQSAKKVLQ